MLKVMMGARVPVPDHPKRILALSSASDTILLGLVEPDRLVGINTLSTYEEYSLEAKALLSWLNLL